MKTLETMKFMPCGLIQKDEILHKNMYVFKGGTWITIL